MPIVDWSESHQWEFHPPDKDKFRLLQLAYEAQDAGGSATCTLNAADEVAVEAFLARRIAFPQIAMVVEETLARVPNRTARSISDILEIDRESRGVASEVATMIGRQLTTGSRARPVSQGEGHSATPTALRTVF